MSDNLEDLLGLPTGEEIDNIRKALAEQNNKIEKSAADADSLSTELTPLAQKAMEVVADREQRVNQIIDLGKFDDDTEILFNESMQAFRDLLSVAQDVPAPSMGKIYEAATNFAKIALDAKNAKIKARLDAISLALNKRKIDIAEGKKNQEDAPIDATGAFMDRNQLLKSIKEELEKEDNKEKPTD